MKSSLTLSIVIPVYNEERYIKRCLDAISKQTVKPLEVIVVDNNCTDKTIKIAEKYSFVKIVKEPIQGRGQARSTGFKSASGDIIGRIDADSLLLPNWSERVISDFTKYDIDAVTGPGKVRVIMGVSHWYSTFWTEVFFNMAKTYFGVQTLWGANMAISATTWQKIKNKVKDDEKYHEDEDISLLIIGTGGHILYDDQLQIQTSGGSYLYWPKFQEYLKMNYRTKQLHKQSGTLKKIKIKQNYWLNIPFAVFSIIATVIFVFYSLICWPIFALLIYHDNQILDKNR